MLKFGVVARHLKSLKPIRQQYTAIRLFHDETPRVLITGLFTLKVCSACLYRSRILMFFQQYINK